MTEKMFVAGLYFKKPHQNAPNFIIGSLSAKKNDLIGFLQNQNEEWVNMSIKESKGGKCYIELDTWKPTKKEEKDEINNNDPF